LVLILAVAAAWHRAWAGALRAHGHAPGGTLTVFAWTCALEALALAVPFALGDRLAVLAAHLRSLSAWDFPRMCSAGSSSSPSWSCRHRHRRLSISLLVSLLGRGGRGVEARRHGAYALNTAGAIVGSLAGGFGLMHSSPLPVCGNSSSSFSPRFRWWRSRWQQRRKRHAARVGVRRSAVRSSRRRRLLFTLGPTAAWRHSGVGVGRSGFDCSDAQCAAR
jgi:hypothetical protein